MEQVLEAFAAERLLTLAVGTVELSHEAVLTAWPLLRDTWLADTQADRIVRSRLHATAAEWARHSRDPSYLYSGSLLQAATDTATRIGADPVRHPPLSQTEQQGPDTPAAAAAQAGVTSPSWYKFLTIAGVLAGHLARQRATWRAARQSASAPTACR